MAIGYSYIYTEKEQWLLDEFIHFFQSNNVEVLNDGYLTIITQETEYVKYEKNQVSTFLKENGSILVKLNNKSGSYVNCILSIENDRIISEYYCFDEIPNEEYNLFFSLLKKRFHFFIDKSYTCSFVYDRDGYLEDINWLNVLNYTEKLHINYSPLVLGIRKDKVNNIINQYLLNREEDYKNQTVVLYW